jgi:hypothetical protein
VAFDLAFQACQFAAQFLDIADQIEDTAGLRDTDVDEQRRGCTSTA